MVGSAAGPIAGGVASAGVSRLLGGGGGGGVSVAAPGPQNFNFGGLEGTQTGGRLTITSGQPRATRVGQLQSELLGRASDLALMRSRFSGPLGELTRARLAGVESSRNRAIGNLRENLARRRLAGSSFASDAVVRAEREFAQAEDEIRAGSILEELDISMQLIREESAARAAAIQTGIQEMNLQADLGAAILAGVTTQLGANARLEAALEAEAARGAGRFFAPAIKGIGSGVSEFVEDLF